MTCAQDPSRNVAPRSTFRRESSSADVGNVDLGEAAPRLTPEDPDDRVGEPDGVDRQRDRGLGA